MKLPNKSDPEALKRLRERVVQEEEKRKSKNLSQSSNNKTTSKKTTSNTSKASNPLEFSALRRYMERNLQRKTEEQGRTNKSAPASTKKNTATKKYADYNTETKNSYDSVKKKLNTKTTIKSNLSDDERNKRIKEIKSELGTLNAKLSGYSRASAYGTSKAMTEAKKKDEARIVELKQELKNLERVGTFSASELKQFEVDDAKAKVSSANAKVNSFGQRPSGSEIEAWRNAVSEQYKANEKLNEVKRQKELYDDITKFSDVVNKDTFTGQWRANYRSNELSREADKAISRYLDNPTEENKELAYAYDAFAKEYAKNNEKALDDENVKASWLTKSAAGYLPQLKDQIVPEAIGYVTGGILGAGVGAPTVGASIGAGIGSGTQNYYVMRGSVYRTLLAEGVDEETALQAANDEALISSLIEGGESALSVLAMGGTKAIGAIMGAAKSSVAKGSTNVATKFIANLATKSSAKAATKVAAGATRPLWNKALRMAGGIALQGASEYVEEFSQGAVSEANREKALATVEKEIGKYGEGNIDLYNRPIYKNADGTISTVDSVTYQIDDKFVVLPTIVRDTNGNAKRLNTDEEILAHYQKTGEYLGEFDTLEDANGYATKLHSAQAYYYDNKTVDSGDNLWTGGAKVVGDAIFGGNTEALKELHEQGWEGAKIGLMFGGTTATVNNVVANYANTRTIANEGKSARDYAQYHIEEGLRKEEGTQARTLAEKLKGKEYVSDVELGKLVIANKQANNEQYFNKAKEDTDVLEALVEEGKSFGGEAKKIAEAIEKKTKAGKDVSVTEIKKLVAANEVYSKAEPTTEADPLEQTAREVVEERNRIDGIELLEARKRGEVTPQMLERLSQVNAEITNEEAKKVTKFGDRGAELVAKLVNTDGATFYETVAEVRPSYLAGFNNPDMDIKKATYTFKDPIHQEAFSRGQQDAVMQNSVAKENAKRATVYNGAFTENEYTKKWSEATKKMVSTVAKHFGMDISVVDKIIASRTVENGVVTEHEANASHDDGKMEISNNKTAEKLIHALVMHESGHRMEQFATDEWNELASFLYERAERLGRRVELGVSQGMLFDDVKAQHDEAGISLTTKGYIGEIAVRELETIFSSPEEFNNFISEIESNQQVKSAWGKFVQWLSELIEDLKRAWSQRKMTAEEKAEARKALAEMERIKELYAKAYLATKDAVAERNAETKSSKNLEIKINEEYNGSISYSLFANEVIFSSRYNAITQSQTMRELYDGAKKGNADSAYKLLSHLLGEDDISKIKGLGNDVHLLPVVGAEGTSTNVLPQSIAEYISVETEQNIFNGIYKRNSSDSRAMSIWDRMKENYPSFTIGEKRNIRPSDIAGKKFVLIDDNSTTGRTFVGLKNFLEENGGEVVGYYALTTGQDQSEKMITTDETWNELLDLGLDKVKDFAEKEGIKREISKHGLTEREAQELIKQFRSTNGNARRGREDVERSGRSREEIQGVSDTEKKDGSTEDGEGINYSLKDSEGNTLNDAQQEYFKDSKVRDENGNLLVVYHGTYEDFTVFDISKTASANVFGKGHYFTNKKTDAQNNYASGEGADVHTKIEALAWNYFEEMGYTEADYESNEFVAEWNDAYDKSEEFYKNGKVMQGYLNIKNPVYAQGSELYDVNGNFVSARSAEYLKELGYDGIIDYGVSERFGSFQELDADTVHYVTFDSEQFKDINNTNPTSNPDINFSLKKSVEATKNLVAVHNMQSSELERTLDLGGLPMPSIAIIKAQRGHSEYGDVSLVFDKSVIDPNASKLNKVYGGDAWTPTYPTIEYKPNEKIAKKIRDKYYDFSRKFGYEESRPLYSYVNDLENQLNRNKGEAGMLEELYNDTRVMQYYLLDSGKGKVETINKETRTELTDEEVKMHEFFIKELGSDVVDEAKWDGETNPQTYRKNYMSKYEGTIREAYKKFLSQEYQFTEEEVQNALDNTNSFKYLSLVRDAQRYRENGRVTIKKEADYEATQNAIREAAGEDYRKWVDSLFKGIEEKSGIRNNLSYYTNSGNQRSWEALHWENNLENVVKVMKSQDDVGGGTFFSAHAIWGVSAKDYRSIEEIKADSERLKSLPKEEYTKIKESFGDRLTEIANSIMDKSERNPFIAVDNAVECIVDAIRSSKTKSGILNNLRQYQHLTVTETTVDDIVSLVSDIANMPTEYFEAKPKRAVELNEIATAIIPDNTSESTKARLNDMGIKFVEYETGNENARLDALNSLEDVKFSLKETNSTSSKDRAELLDIIEHLKGEFEVTKFAKADPKKLAKMTREILKDYDSKADYDETYNAIDELYQYMANGEEGNVAWEDVYSRAYNVARTIVENSLVRDDTMYQEYKHLRDYLRTTPMKFTAYDSVPSGYENFNDFRKHNMGRLKFVKDGMSIDSVYQELAHLYPEFFDAEEQINSADQLERIIDVLDELQPMEINPFDRQIEQASMQLANDLTSRFFDVPQAKPTFADKAERRVVEAHIKGGKKVEAVRQQKDAKIKKLIESQREKTKKQLDKLREQRDTKVEKEKAKRRDAISKMSENQKAKVLRARITRHASELSKKLVSGTDNQHIPFELRGAVATLLEHINLESNYTYDAESHSYKKNDEGLPTKRTQAFNELKKVYADIASSVVVDPDLLGEYGLLSDVISLADKRIADMTSNELEKVWQTIRAIEASISTANKVFSEGKFATIFEVADTLRAYNEGKTSKAEFKGIIGKGKKLATLDMLTPETYLHYLGSAGDSIFRMMRDAQDKHISIMKEVADFTHKELKDVNVNKLENTIHTVKLGGEDVKLSTAQIMELYVLMKREQAKEHILIGGILPDVTKGKGLKQNTRANPTRNISIGEIAEAISVLTDEQMKIADKLQRYVSSVLSKYGNEASMQVYNYEKFTEENYWTIRTNKQEIQSDIDKDTAVTSVANKGMTKATKPHANTSVRIGSIFDTFASHSSDMATYAAWLGTSEDVNRIRNFVFWEDGARTGTVKGILDTVHGIHGSQYLEKLLTDISIGVKGTDNLNPFDKLVGNYKAASVGANIRVIIQQPTALIRAIDMINPIHLAEGAVRPLNGWKKAKKYAPIAQWKDWGYFDINTGRQMKDVMFDNASLLEKTKQAGMWGASMADSLAWGQLWNAVEAETKSKHKELEVGSDAYYETVAKRFTEIVDHTQVVDGIMQRSQIMRSPDALTKMATSFMGEPTKQYNMAVAALHDAIAEKGDARKKSVKRLGRTAMALAVSGIINACAQSIVDALRDDDKEKDYWEKWLAAFKGDGEETKLINSNIGDTVNPLNYVPFAKDIISIMQGYDVKRMDTETITKTYNAATNMYKAITGTGKYTIAEASAQLFAEIARMYGVPVANVKRDVKSVAMTVATETDSYLMQYRMEKAMLNINYAGNNKNFMDILFNAYNNDREAYEFIYNDMLDSGYDADKIKSGMETRMKKAEGVTEASELTKRYMTPETEEQYDSSLDRVKSSSVWNSASSTQRKNAEADLYNFLTSTTEDMEKTRAEARAFGVDETEYTLWQLAIEMADQPKGAEGSGSYSAKEKAEAINLLDFDDEEIAYFFGKGLNDYAKEELNETLNAGIDMQEYVNFKAAVNDMKADKNANGKSIPNSKKRKVVNYLNSANLTSDEWDYFYYEIMNYKK